jgi:hypothetical protein
MFMARVAAFAAVLLEPRHTAREQCARPGRHWPIKSNSGC